MNYLEALNLIEEGKIVKCNENDFLFRKHIGKIEFKDKKDKHSIGWKKAASNINYFIQLTFEKYNEPQIPLDTQMDAKILVSIDGEKWYNRHFVKFDERGNVVTWSDGKTSFSACDKGYWSSWNYAKLPEESITEEENEENEENSWGEEEV